MPDPRPADPHTPSIDEARRCFHEGRLDEAWAVCAQLIEAQVEVSEAWHVRAAVRLKQGRVDDALTEITSALACGPSGSCFNTLAAIHLQRGDGPAARAALARAQEIKGDDPRLWPNIGRALLLEGRHDEAAAWLARAVEARPDWPSAWFVRGAVEAACGRPETAARAYDRAAALQDGWLDATHQAALCWLQAGARARARARWLEVLARDPGRSSARDALIEVLPGPGDTATEALVREVEAMVEAGGYSLQRICDALPALLCVDAGWRTLLGSEPECLAAADFDRVTQSSLLRPLLERGLITDLALEAVLTAWRRGVLEAVLRDEAPDTRVVAFATAVALHGWRSGYAWRETAAERAALNRLGTAPVNVLVRACYRRPEASEGLPPSLITRLEETARLRERAERLVVLRAPVASVAREVADQYESHPYPPWETLRLGVAPCEPAQTATHVASPGRRVDPPARAAGEPLRILVAGCGTGRHAIDVALRYRPAEVLAIDISRTSLAYAEEKAHAFGVAGIRFAVADLSALAPSDLGPLFHHIECVGVLHHLADPADGWRRLRALLAPGGTMKVGLYSRTFRAALAPARQCIAGTDSRTDEGLRDARTALLARLPARDLALLRTFSDFYSTAGLRDMLLHACEHVHDLDEIEGLLNALALGFVGFDDLPPALVAAFRARHGAEGLSSMAAWRAFEAAHPHTFRAMYVFWCQALDLAE